MATALTQTFNQEAEVNHPKTEPILVDVRNVDGQKQYVVHEFSRWGAAASVVGLGEEDDIETYNEEEYQKEYGDNPPRTLEAYKAEYEELEGERIRVLEGAVNELNKIGFNHMIEPSRMGDLNHVEDMLNSHVNDLYGEGAGVAESIDAAVTKSAQIKYTEAAMNERLGEIGQDMQDHGEAVPEIVKGFEP